MKKKVNNGSDSNSGEVPKQKERHIVSWSQEEDDILREQIRLHGTENWAIIASKFKDKTTRQCRRRWFTYLNSDFKKGGWSPEEDMLLCEAQKIFGNRWTEIAKVVSGRTDNAVKNRFTTLCKKRAKHEALAKENSTATYINLNNKRVIFPNGLNTGGSESAAPLKKMRTYVLNTTESQEEKLAGECGNANHPLRPPFAVLAQNVHSSGNNKSQGTFLKKDDPKVLALMQQAELLSSLAIKVNTEKTDQSLESAWMALQDFLKQNKEGDLFTFTNPDTDFQLEKFKDLLEDLRNDDEGSRPSWREPDIYESSSASSEYSAGSTLLPSMQGDKTEECQIETCVLHQENGHELQSDQLDHQHCLAEGSRICHTASKNEVNMLTCNDTKDNDEAICEYSSTEFGSPLHVTPLFRALAATIPSPKFSESHIRDIKDPEHPYSLEELKVITEDAIEVDDRHSYVRVTFTPTVEHCSMATVIGLCLRVKLTRSLPPRYKVDIRVAPGSHATEAAVNKQLNDKERVAAALENPNLVDMVDECLAPSYE